MALSRGGYLVEEQKSRMATMDAGGPQRATDARRQSGRGAPGQPESTSRGAALSHALGVEAYVADAPPASWMRNLASQDWLMVGYLAAILGALALGGGPNRGLCFARVSADLAIFLLVLVLVRGERLRWGGSASSLLYRTAVMGVLLSSFFQLREILPAVSPWADDARIYAIDLRVFGFEPSVTMDPFVTPQTTEWFAFFYFLYFLILCVHILPMLYWQRDTNLLAGFATGVLIVFLTAHLAYMVVPGLGPYWYLRSAFHHELEGRTFWPLVRQTVDAGGPQKDIFPSLHTAVPTYFALFSFRHRRLFPFKYTWPGIAFLATQIIIATMFLRWHYLLDVMAGLLLATVGALVGHRIADWERAKRERLRLQPVWMPLAYPWSRAQSD